MFTSEDIRERVAKICRVFDAHVYDVTATTTDQVTGYLEANELTDEEIDGVDLVVQETLQANLRNCHEVNALSHPIQMPSLISIHFTLIHNSVAHNIICINRV